MTPSSQNPRSILFLGSQMEIGGAQKNLLMQAEWWPADSWHACMQTKAFAHN